MDREAWRAAVHGVAESRTRLNHFWEIQTSYQITESVRCRELPDYIVNKVFKLYLKNCQRKCRFKLIMEKCRDSSESIKHSTKK